MTSATSDPAPEVPAGRIGALGRLSTSGAALLEAGRPDEAVDVLLHAVAAGEPGADDLLARAYLDGGDWHSAAEFLRRQIDQGEVRFAGRLGAALVEIGDGNGAEAAFRLAIGNGELAATNDLAYLLRREGRLDEAVLLLERAADLGEPQAAATLVELLLDAGLVGRAVAAAERYADENRPDTLVALADARATVGRVDEAEALYRRAGLLGAARAHGAYGGFLFAVRGDLAGAERELREAGRQAEPGWEFALGRFLVDDGRGREARPYVAAAAAMGDDDAVTLLAEIDGEDPFDD